MRLKSLLKQVTTFSVVGRLAFGLAGCSVDNSVKESKETAATADNQVSEGTDNQQAASNVLDKDTLIIGLDDTFAPMGFKDEKGEIVGFDVDLAKAVAEKLGKKIEFQPIDWSMKETELKSGNIDFIWNGYSITDERKEQVAFGTPYLKNRQIIITLADSPINTKADLKDKVVGAQTGSTAVDAIETEPEVLATFKDGKPVTYETNNDVLMDLEAGRLDAVVADEIIVKYYISKKGAEKYKILDEDFGEEEYGVGMRKEDTALVEAFNKAYAELKQEGKLAEISKTWFGDDITQ